MRAFMDGDFLLGTDTARTLYHETAANLPIIDYHCHISPREIAEDVGFEDISRVWLGGDHYKWRLMRACGIPEEKITGDAPGREKFRAFAEIMPELIGNPVYHWSHLELKRVFGIEEPLSAENADSVYDRANRALEGMTARKIMRKFSVRAVCTTDDPCDDLRWHRQIAEDPSMEIKVLPAFRPDAALNVDREGFSEYIEKLGEVSGVKISCAEDVCEALSRRMDFFESMGCLCADHGLDRCVYSPAGPGKADLAFSMAMDGEVPPKDLADAYRTFLLTFCAKRYAELGWVMQIHFGCRRNVNRPMYSFLGPDTGYDCVSGRSGSENLAPLLNGFYESGGLPRMILYSLNPADTPVIASAAGCFQDGTVPGKIQLGSAWWFNDSLHGIKEQLTVLASMGVLGRFVGMLTDSRSFLSYTRHEYFRRILCDLIGGWVEEGQYPGDTRILEKLVSDICFGNTNEFFGFGV